MNSEHLNNLVRCIQAVGLLLDNRNVLELSDNEVDVLGWLKISICEDIEAITKQHSCLC